MNDSTNPRPTARSPRRAPESFHNERSDDKGTATAPQHVEFSVPGLLWPDEAAWFYSWTGAERHDALVKVVADRLVWAEWRVWLNPVIHAAKLDIYADDRDEAIRRARRELQRVSPEWRDSSIVIERVTPAGEVT